MTTSQRIVTPRGSRTVEHVEAHRRFLVALARAGGGALIFALPLLMTMEMWQLGVHMKPLRLALLVVLLVPLLVGLSPVSGFEDTVSLREDLRDAFVAFAVGMACSALVLAAVGALRAGMSLREVVGTVTLQAVPASIGALLARSQLGGQREREAEAARRGERYWLELFLMAAGALFLAFNLAPTEEIVRIAYRIEAWTALVLAVLSIVVMHAFVYAVEFRGQHAPPEGMGSGAAFLRLTVTGYAVVLLISAYVLWSFGRFEGDAPLALVMSTVVLGFPAAVGAAAARLIL